MASVTRFHLESKLISPIDAQFNHSLNRIIPVCCHSLPNDIYDYYSVVMVDCIIHFIRWIIFYLFISYYVYYYLCCIYLCAVYIYFLYCIVFCRRWLLNRLIRFFGIISFFGCMVSNWLQFIFCKDCFFVYCVHHISTSTHCQTCLFAQFDAINPLCMWFIIINIVIYYMVLLCYRCWLMVR